jgi:hypothetical protein
VQFLIALAKAAFSFKWLRCFATSGARSVLYCFATFGGLAHEAFAAQPSGLNFLGSQTKNNI